MYSPSNQDREILESEAYHEYYYSRPGNTRLRKPLYNVKPKLGLIKSTFIFTLVEPHKLSTTEEIEEKDEYFLPVNDNRDGGEGSSKEEWQESNQINFNSKSRTERYSFATEGENYTQLYPPASVPSVSKSFSSSAPPYFAHGNYVYPRSDYMMRPIEQPSSELPYRNYGQEYSRPPGISTYSTTRLYSYPYNQPDTMYGYDPRSTMENYYVPTRNNNWSLPSYEQGEQYYAGQPSTLHNVSQYQPVDYRVHEYRPRATIAPYNAFLENFKQKLTYAKKISIEELKGHVVELSKDQFGSRYFQQRIQENSPEEKEIIYKELKPKLNELMTDAFGNYVVQIFIQYGLPNQRNELITTIIKNTMKLAFNMYGCRCIQKALSMGTLDQRIAIVNEIKDNITACIESQHANHVIQKCIECLEIGKILFLLDYVKSNVRRMSCHMYGYRIILKIVEKVNAPEANVIIEEIAKSTVELSQNQYGNYVVQHVLDYGKSHHKEKIVIQLKDQILNLSKQKFSSNVIEKCFHSTDEKSRELLIHSMLGKEGDL